MPNKPLTWIGKRARAKRSKVIAVEQWEALKHILHQKYVVEKLSLRKVAVFMLEQHDFNATERQYGRQFEKWIWPSQRSREVRSVYTTVPPTVTQISLDSATTGRWSLQRADEPTPISNSNLVGDVAERESHFTEASYSPRQNQGFDYFLNSDASERCSLKTSSSSVTSRTLQHSLPATPTPDLSEPLYLPAASVEGYLKLPSKNAFRPETPEYHQLDAPEYEDILRIFPRPVETPELIGPPRKQCHRQSSIIDGHITLPTNTWSPESDEDLGLQPVVSENARLASSSLHHALASRSFLIEDCEEEEEEEDLSNNHRPHQGLELNTLAHVQQTNNQLTTIREDVEIDITLFPHKHDLDISPEGFCCWPQAAETTLKQCSTEAAFQVDLAPITSPKRCFANVALPAKTPKGFAILGNVMNIASKIDTGSIESEDIAKLLRMADFLSAARLYDDSFAWSQVTWELLNKRSDPKLATVVTDRRRLPIWLAIFTNMLKSSAGPEHLQLSAAALSNAPALNSFQADILHPSMAVLYAYLGETLQRTAVSQSANEAAVGCWDLIPELSLSPPNYLVRRIISSAIDAGFQKSAATLPDATSQRFTEIRQLASTGPDDASIRLDLKYCVRNILGWCREVLKHNAFSRMVENIDESFWVSSIDPLDVARFERLAVFGYLCQSLWSQERLDYQASPLRTEHVDVVDALQTLTDYTGLTREAIIAAVLGIAKPIQTPSLTPQRHTMASRFCQSIEMLYNNTAMKATGFDHVGRTMDIHDLMDRFAWAGNSASSLDEFSDVSYARKVGIFLRESASSGIELPGSKPLLPILGDLHEGDRFVQDTLLQSTRSSQMSMDTRSFMSFAKRISQRPLRTSSSSWSLRRTDSGESASDSFGFRRNPKYSSSLKSSIRKSPSMSSLRESFHTWMSLDSDHGKHVSTSSNDVTRSNIREEDEK